MNSGGQDADIAAAYAADAAMGATVEMAMYAIELAGKRRSEPAEDLTTLVLAMEVDGEAMTDVQFGSFFVQIVTAGNDTTRTMLSSGLLALLQHPDQLAELRADPSLIPDAVEEILRWANPLHYFRRTATADTELGGASIRTGDKVAMIYTSANRDETVFVRPQEFDIHRDPNPHLSFGTGEHFCLGIHLAAPRGPRVPRGAAGTLSHHRARRRSPPPTLQPQQRAQGAPGHPLDELRNDRSRRRPEPERSGGEPRRSVPMRSRSECPSGAADIYVWEITRATSPAVTTTAETRRRPPSRSLRSSHPSAAPSTTEDSRSVAT